MNKQRPLVTIELDEYNFLIDLKYQFDLYRDCFDVDNRTIYNSLTSEYEVTNYLSVRFEDLEKFTTNLFGGEKLVIREEK